MAHNNNAYDTWHEIASNVYDTWHKITMLMTHVMK